MRRFTAALLAATVATLVLAAGSALAGTGGSTGIAPLRPTVGTAVAFDRSPALRDMQMIAPGAGQQSGAKQMATDRSLVGSVPDAGHQRDGALQNGAVSNAMPAPLLTLDRKSVV